MKARRDTRGEDDEEMKSEGQRGENGVTVLFMGTSSTVPGLREVIY